MTQFYSDESRQDDPYSLPDCEVFYMDRADIHEFDWRDGNDDPCEPGWYWWSCFPGCLPDSEPNGPFATEAEAIADARDGLDL